MQVAWDDAKDATSEQKHGIIVVDAATVFLLAAQVVTGFQSVRTMHP